ncbi:MAG: SRPBCC family protein [Acidobacteriota bacterium]
MIGLLIALAVIAALIAAVALAGSLLPSEHTAQASIDLTSSAERVWATVSDFAATTRWRADVRAVEMTSAADGTVRFVESTRQGSTTFEVVSRQAPHRQVVRIVDEGLPYGGTWTWDLRPVGGGTRLVVTEEGFIRNPVFRIIGRLFMRPSASIEEYLRELAGGLGESSKPVTTRDR